MTNTMAQIEALPDPIRQRALHAIEVTQAYGSELESVEIRQTGGALHCILHFDLGIIQFVSPVQVTIQGGVPNAPRAAHQDLRPQACRCA